MKKNKFNHKGIYAGLMKAVGEASLAHIRTMDALLVRACGGDVVAGLMAKHIISWRRYADGDVYKTASDWDAECGLSTAQIKRVKARGLLERVGIYAEVRTMRHGRATFYRIDIDVLVNAIVEALSAPIARVWAWLTGRKADDSAPAPSGENMPTHRAESAQPISEKAPNPSGENMPTDWAESDRHQRDSREIHQNDVQHTSGAMDEQRAYFDVGMRQLDVQVPYVYESFLKGARFDGVRDGVMHIHVNSQHRCEMLQGRYYRVVRKVFADIAGNDDLALQFSAPPPLTLEAWRKKVAAALEGTA